MKTNNTNNFSYYTDKNWGLYNFKNKEKCEMDLIFYMLDRTQSIFRYENLPETIPQRILEMMLQIHGFVVFTEHNGGFYVYWGGLGGVPDVYYEPTICVVSNPAQNFSKEFKLGEDCILMNNDSFRLGLIPMFRKYATMMVENELSMRVSEITTRLQTLISASDDITRKSAVAIFEQADAGDLGIIAEGKMLEGLKAQPYAPNGASTISSLIEFEQYLKASWFNELGLNSNYNMKREAINSIEAQLNDDALLPFVDDMMRNRKTAIDQINEKYGLDIKVEFASSWEEKQEENKEEEDILEETDETTNEIEEEVKEDDKTDTE